MTNVVRDAYENLILQLYPESPLPFCWQVVYQEAMRNHHLLFATQDVQDFLQSDRSKVDAIIRDFGDELTEIFSDLMCLGVYSDIKARLSLLSKPLLEGTFHLYLRVLKTWTYDSRLAMH